jgi:hypothetical protein
MPKLRINEKGFPIRYKRILKLVEEGKTPKEVADQLKMDYTWVCKILKKPAFIAATASIYANAAEAARAIFEKSAVDAAAKIVNISKSGKPDSRVQLDAAKEILYQIGLKPVEVIETRGRDYTPEEIQSSLTVMKEVQAIEEKLSTLGSGFLVQSDTDDTVPSLSAPVNAGKAEVTPVV